MEKTLAHLATAKTNSGSLPTDRPNSTRKIGRAGAHSPGSASRGCSGSSGGSRGALVGNSVTPQNTHARQLEGVLSKYTNLIQGWQNRYFVLDPELSQLQYFVNEQGRGQKPRGTLPLIGASITPSDEAPHMFIISSANGELFKLRAVDVKEQQLWMTQLQACARRHSDGSTKVRKLKDSDDHLCEDRTTSNLDTQASSGRTRSFSLLPHLPPSSSPGLQRHLGHGGGPSNIVTITHHKSPAAARRAKQQYPGRLLEVREVMSQVEAQQKTLVQSIEELPRRGAVSCLDQDLLLLKATSAATLSCLGECLSILQHSHAQPGHAHTHTHVRAPPSDGAPVWTVPKSPSADCVRNGSVTPTCSTGPSPTLKQKGSTPHTEQVSVELVSPSEEVTDTEDNVEEELGLELELELEDQRSIILHLLSQLKLGMDLTRVVLPTFILEKRSLLEMYANFMAHPDIFLAITAGTTPEERMVRFVEYYLTAFHEGRKGAVAKKPYNPILGETFHCSWEVPRDKLHPLRTHAHSAGAQEPNPRTNQEAAEVGQGSYRVRFVAEQVSHHPPVSAFYCECRERGVCVNTHVWTKSKFMGMSVGVSMVGEGVLSLLDHGEEYVFTLPSAYARSILTVPWVELGGKVTITCAQSGYSATVTFHTKPFYGGKVHRVTAEVKQNSTGTIVCKAQGEWNGTLEFTYSSLDTKVIDTTKLPVIKKLIRPVEKQGRTESRNLWQHVTRALKEGNIDTATERKHHLEEGQRSEERQRATNGSPWKPKYFTKQGDGWVYNNPLWETH